jgi:hypothetical protein
VVVLGLRTGVLDIFVLPALPVPAVGFLTAGFLVATAGFVGGLVVDLAADLLAGLVVGLVVLLVLVVFATVVEDFLSGLGVRALAAFLAGIFAPVSTFALVLAALVRVFGAALVTVVLTVEGTEVAVFAFTAAGLDTVFTDGLGVAAARLVLAAAVFNRGVVASFGFSAAVLEALAAGSVFCFPTASFLGAAAPCFRAANPSSGRAN